MLNNDEENQALQSDQIIKELTLQNKKLSRELRMNKSFLDKVTQMVEAKEAIGSALSANNTRQKAYTDILLENCPNIILLLDNNGRFVLSTKMFLTACGFHNFDMIRGRAYYDVFQKYMPAEVMEHLREAIDAVMREKKNVILTEWVDFSLKDNMRCYSIELNSIDGSMGADAGFTAGVLAVFVDLTDIMREKQRSEVANNAKSDFLAAMSHEIRTPMNAILGMSEMLSRSELTPPQEKYINDIKTSSQALLAIINDILDFSKVEAGKLDINCSSYNLRSLLDNLSSMFTLMFEKKGLELDFIVEKDVPYSVYGDENRLRQALTNILSNAMKYTVRGGAVFTARLNGGLIQFELRDTGIGIRDEDKDKLFKPFEQLDTRKNKNVVGTGLGLAISYRLCKLMGGDLSFQSVYGNGSTFTVTIPYIPAEEGVEEDIEIEPDEFKAPDARILIVDDIEINLTVAEAMLGEFDVVPSTAMRGIEAIELIKRQVYDLILMDHMMPDMDGIEATKLIRLMGGWCEHVPVVALTANVVNGAEEMFLQNGFNDFLPKPLEFAALNRCLRRWLPKDKVCES